MKICSRPCRQLQAIPFRANDTIVQAPFVPATNRGFPQVPRPSAAAPGGVSATPIPRRNNAIPQVSVTVPESGFELVSPGGRVIAEAEVAWPDRKVAVLLAEQRVWAA